MVGLDKVFDGQLPVGCNVKLHCFAETHRGEIVAFQFAPDGRHTGHEIIGVSAEVDEHPVVPGDAANLDQIGAMTFGLVDVVLLTAMKMRARDQPSRQAVTPGVIRGAYRVGPTYLIDSIDL